MFPLPSLCFGNPLAGVDTWFQELHKRGGTTMAPDLERWEAADTHSLHTYVPVRGFLGIFRGCRRVEALPLGWGAAEAGVESGGPLQADPGGARFNAGAAGMAEGEMIARPVPGMATYEGIAVVRDLDYGQLADPRFPISRVAVLARTEGAAARTANALNLGAGRFRLAERFAGGRLWSLSAAQVYFRRPPTDADRLEFLRPRQRGEHHIARAAKLGHALCPGCAGCQQGGGARPVDVMDDEIDPRFRKVRGHAMAHGAKADKSDVHDAHPVEGRGRAGGCPPITPA